LEWLTAETQRYYFFLLSGERTEIKKHSAYGKIFLVPASLFQLETVFG
jgi:hypothetical protein